MHGTRTAFGAGALAVLFACSGESGQRPAAHVVPAATGTVATPGPYRWQAVTRSPQEAEPPSGDLAAPCARGDAALVRVAERVAERELAGAPLDASELRFALRTEGAPYVWPHVWTLSGSAAPAAAAESLSAWLATIAEGGERRCALVRTGGEPPLIAVVAVSVLADLDPLPTRARVGAWIRVRARLLAAATEAEVLVLGPRGAPHRVPASLADGVVSATFSADSEGQWLVQVLANVLGGPRPVAEAVLSAGSEPPTRYADEPAPGEDAGQSSEPESALLGMVNAARSHERLGSLLRADALDRIARAHATAMRDARTLAHDAGDGSPPERAERAGISAAAVGENVAHAADAARAHRMLWASPSHRSNLLEARFDTIGIGAVRDDDGTLWVCQVFADSR